MMEHEREDRHHFKTVGEASRFQLSAFLVTLLIVVGVKLVRSGLDANDPIWQIVGLVITLAIGVGVPLAVIKWKRRRDRTDFTKAFGNKMPRPRTDVPAGELLVPDASVAEVAELSKRFEAQGIRFEVRQTVIDNSFHQFGNGGIGTRMCVYVHPDDCAAAQPIVDNALTASGVDGSLARTTEERG